MRVLRCFAFLDLCGFSAHTEEHGDEQAVAVLGQLRTVLRTATERRGVRLTKWLGDGAMLSSVDAEALVGCVLETRHRLADQCPLELRAGIAQGQVIMFEGDDYVGAAVNTAARLCEAAAPGQVLAAGLDGSPVTWADARPLRALEIAGLRRPVETVEIVVRPSRTGMRVVDPVCGLALDPEAELTISRLPGSAIRFCSAACAASWDPA